jgi:hypothetical protein
VPGVKVSAAFLVLVFCVVTHAGVSKMNLHDVSSPGVSDIHCALLLFWSNPLDSSGAIKSHCLASVFCGSHKI